jgi:hypothetical protein
MISTLIALPYELARMPLVIIDNSLSDRLPESSALRVTLEQAVGGADSLVGALLSDRRIAQRGADRLERSEMLAAAARLEEEAETRREQARQTDAVGRREASAKRRAAQHRAASGLEAAAAEEARGKQAAKAKAAQTAAAKKAAADERAASRKAAGMQDNQRKRSAIDARARASQRKARYEIAAARATKRSAAAIRADAERLGDLTKAKKQTRKQS